MRKLMILGLIAAILSASLVLAQPKRLPMDSVATVVSGMNSTDLTLAEIAARGEVTVYYPNVANNHQSQEAILAELSAQGFVNIVTAKPYDFTCAMSTELRELSAQGVVTVKSANYLCTS